MKILGIGDVTHDSSACIVDQNRLLAAIESERITRIKHNMCLDDKFYHVKKHGPYIRSILDSWTLDVRENRHLANIKYCLEASGLKEKDIDMLVISSLFDEMPFKDKAVFIPHHVAHAASAFYPSSYENAAILVVDGYGKLVNSESVCTMFAKGHGNKIDVISNFVGRHDLNEEERKNDGEYSQMTFQNSLGVFYQNVTVLLGFGLFGEGKTMGISAYGKRDPRFDEIDNYIEFASNGEIKINNRGIFLKITEWLNTAKNSLSKKDLFQFKANLALKHQYMLEQMIFHLCQKLYDITGYKNLCLAGGVALNSVVNGKILSNTPFENLFIQPASGDNGIAIGCALYGSHTIKNQKRYYLASENKLSPFLGKKYENYPNQLLLKNQCVLIKTSDALKTIAELISQKLIIAWFDGKSEIGPRALGSRSILSDARFTDMKDRLNLEIKHRETFRPFAPAVLSDKASAFFHIKEYSPYMLKVCNVKTEKKYLIPAAIHVDGSARIQTVHKELSPKLFSLIEHYESITGIPLVINTSFNIAGEPIVETPLDAIKCFIKTKIDVLYLNGNIYLKQSVFEAISESKLINTL